MSRTFKDGGVPFCWHCSKQLMRKRGGFHFAIVIDRDNRKHRVHHECVDSVVSHEDGIKKVDDEEAES